MADRSFNKKQALEKEIKDVYAKVTFGTVSSPTATFATTAPIIMTHSLKGSYLNGRTVTLVVNAAAANPTSTLLLAVTGTASAIVLTVTPNNGTNNTGTPVTFTTANLVQYLTSGTVTAKTVTLTDTGSLIGQIVSATGGGSTPLAHSGEGDGLVATFSGGADNITNNSVAGIASFARNSAGDYTVTLQDAYIHLRNFKAVVKSSTAQDLRVQIVSDAVHVSSSKTLEFSCLTGTVPTDPVANSVLLIKFELKNSSAV